ncbi:MAG: hypothetical protein IJ690_01080 [Clostridia bacterium]|nr:hypothetical protein [Clostridia bacterium]
MEITIEDLLKQMLNFFQNIDKELKKTKEDEKIINQKQEDILHYIEGVSLNAGGYAKAGKLLKSIRQERRAIKNTIERLELIQGFTTKFNNRMIQGDIIQLLKGLSTIEKRQNEPKYNCRTNILEELITQDEQIQKQESNN